MFRFGKTLFLLAALFVCCTSDDLLAERIRQLAGSSVGKSVDLDSVNPVSWDEIALFGPYFPKEHACKVLALSSWSCFWLPYPRPDDSSPSMVVFLSKGEIVRSAFLPRCEIEIGFRSGSKSRAHKGSGRFLVSQREDVCKHGLLRLNQE